MDVLNATDLPSERERQVQLSKPTAYETMPLTVILDRLDGLNGLNGLAVVCLTDPHAKGRRWREQIANGKQINNNMRLTP